MASLALALLFAGATFALDADPPPPVSVTVSDEKGEAAFRPTTKWGNLTLRPVVKAGALALTEQFPYPYPILNRSPYAVAGSVLQYDGVVQSMVAVTIGGAQINSHRLFDDPNGELGSSASRSHAREVSNMQTWRSVYADVGKTFDAGGGWRGSFYAALDAMGWSTKGTEHGQDGLMSETVGTAWLKRMSGGGQLHLFGDVSAEGAPRNAYRNDGKYEQAPSAKAGVEYSAPLRSGRWLAGVETLTRRADDSIRPFAGVEGRDVSGVLALDARRSKDAFYPDSKALAASVQARVTKNLTASVTGRYQLKSYELGPGSMADSRVEVGLAWTPGGGSVVSAAKSWGMSRKPEYSPDKERALQKLVDDSPRRDEIRALIAASPTLPDFLSAYKPKDQMGVILAASEFTRLFSAYNYNYTEGAPPNLDKVGQLYERMRQSYLDSKADPILVCIGAAQYTAALAEELGARNGIPVRATGVTVESAAANGGPSGHAVAAIRTRDTGIVFVDWGKVVPTYTFDTERALRVYQALVGTPAVYHEITDPKKNGRHVGYLFTEEGKLMVNALTFHGELSSGPLPELFKDEPRGDDVANARYKGLLQKK